MALGLCNDLVSGTAQLGAIDILLCPPATLLNHVHLAVEDSPILVGAQDIDEHEEGAYTGQVSAAMVRDAGGSHTLVGHSERRTLFAEANDRVAAKFAAALDGGLTPILCVGETQSEREAGETEAVVASQVNAVIERCGIQDLGRGVIAYEPVWAIGTGLTASPEQAQAVHAYIRGLLAGQHDEVASGCRILYGGSMKPANAEGLMQQPDIDGGLIGGASLVGEEFIAICQAAAAVG